MEAKRASLVKELRNSHQIVPDGDSGRGRHFSSRLQKLCGIFNLLYHLVVLYLVYVIHIPVDDIACIGGDVSLQEKVAGYFTRILVVNGGKVEPFVLNSICCVLMK